MAGLNDISYSLFNQNAVALPSFFGSLEESLLIDLNILHPGLIQNFKFNTTPEMVINSSGSASVQIKINNVDEVIYSIYISLTDPTTSFYKIISTYANFYNLSSSNYSVLADETYQPPVVPDPNRAPILVLQTQGSNIPHDSYPILDSTWTNTLSTNVSIIQGTNRAISYNTCINDFQILSGPLFSRDALTYVGEYAKALQFSFFTDANYLRPGLGDELLTQVYYQLMCKGIIRWAGFVIPT